jgi:hypothetical protein
MLKQILLMSSTMHLTSDISLDLGYSLQVETNKGLKVDDKCLTDLV